MSSSPNGMNTTLRLLYIIDKVTNGKVYKTFTEVRNNCGTTEYDEHTHQLTVKDS